MKFDNEELVHAMSPSLTEDAIIPIMTADPKPYNILTLLHCYCTVVNPNAHRPEPTHFLEVERWVRRVAFEQFETLVCQSLNLGW